MVRDNAKVGQGRRRNNRESVVLGDRAQTAMDVQCQRGEETYAEVSRLVFQAQACGKLDAEIDEGIGSA